VRWERTVTKRYLEPHVDELRRWLLFEPRGKPSLCVNLVTPPTRPDCDAGMIIMESSDYPDRSLCGTGTSARLAVLHARGYIAPGQGFVHESIIGSRFEAGIAGEVTVGGRPGIVPPSPADPLRGGYTLPDLWFA